MRCVKEFASDVYNNHSIWNDKGAQEVRDTLRDYDCGVGTEVDAMERLVKIARDDTQFRIERYGHK